MTYKDWYAINPTDQPTNQTETIYLCTKKTSGSFKNAMYKIW